VKNLEKLLDFKKRLNEDRVNLSRMQAELNELKEELPALQDKVIEAEALQTEGWQKLKKEFEEKQKRLEQLPGEISKLKRKIEVLSEHILELEEAAIKELKEYYFRQLKPLVSSLVKKLKEIYELERKISEVKDEARRTLTQVTSFPRVITPFIPIFLYEPDPSSGVRIDSSDPLGRPAHRKFRTILKNLKEEGFDVDLDLSE
jgi:predicted  nucleic acid-binding Zn-ribbon protein